MCCCIEEVDRAGNVNFFGFGVARFTWSLVGWAAHELGAIWPEIPMMMRLGDNRETSGFTPMALHHEGGPAHWGQSDRGNAGAFGDEVGPGPGCVHQHVGVDHACRRVEPPAIASWYCVVQPCGRGDLPTERSEASDKRLMECGNVDVAGVWFKHHSVLVANDDMRGNVAGLIGVDLHDRVVDGLSLRKLDIEEFMAIWRRNVHDAARRENRNVDQTLRWRFEEREAPSRERSNRACPVVQGEQRSGTSCCVMGELAFGLDQRDAFEFACQRERVRRARSGNSSTNDYDMIVSTHNTTVRHHRDRIDSRDAAPKLRFVFALSVLFAACAGFDDSLARGDGIGKQAEVESTEIPVATVGEPATDQELCRPDVIGEEEGPIVVIYLVERGQLGDACFGDPSLVAEESWLSLAEVVPPQELDAVRLFAGYEPSPQTTTVAFAGPIVGGRNDRFLIAVDLQESEADPEELRLTMAHEFSHVFTQEPDQLDLSISPRDCVTFHNSFGCFTDDAYLTAWVAEFWTPEEIESLPTNGSADEDGGDERCSLDPAHIGAYGASHPEEDFAESFSAYVFGLDVRPESQSRLDFFDRYPELRGFRDRAEAADLVGLPNNFGECG